MSVQSVEIGALKLEREPGVLSFVDAATKNDAFCSHGFQTFSAIPQQDNRKWNHKFSAFPGEEMDALSMNMEPGSN